MTITIVVVVTSARRAARDIATATQMASGKDATKTDRDVAAATRCREAAWRRRRRTTRGHATSRTIVIVSMMKRRRSGVFVRYSHSLLRVSVRLVRSACFVLARFCSSFVPSFSIFCESVGNRTL